MKSFTIGMLVFTLANPLYAGGFCYPVRSHCAPVIVSKPVAVTAKPVYHAPQPITQISYTYNLTQPAAVQGATVYGTHPSYSSLASVYGQSDLGALYQQAIRLASDSQTYGAQATAGVQGLVAQAGQERARIAEIVAKGQAASQALAAAAPANSAHVSVQPAVTAQASVQTGAAVQVQGGGDAAAVYAQRCATCHANAEVAKARGGDAVIDIAQLDANQKKIVRDRITSHTERRMPKGGTLSDQELSVLLDYLCK